MLNSKKTYYSIREVSQLTSLEPHVLRYWESEFSNLRPKKNRAGNRAYREKDIEIIINIKRLLYDDLYTILGAKKKLIELCKHRHDTDIIDTDNINNKTLLKEVIEDLKYTLKIFCEADSNR